MGFRDDREANVQRIETLERDLAATKAELEAANLRAVEVDDLRKRLAVLTDEKEALSRGVSPQWASSNQRLRGWLVVLAGVLVVLGYVGYQAHTRSSTDAVRLQARTDADLATCDAELQEIRAQRDTARSELAQIDQVHQTEVQGLEHDLLSARRTSGPALVVSAHVVSQSGFHPPSIGHDCVLTLRSLGRGYCAAEVTCGAARVFPFNEPPPDVRCTAADGSPWRTDAPLGRAIAIVASSPSTPLLAYDPASGTLDVRETGTPTFALRLRVADIAPFVLR